MMSRLGGFKMGNNVIEFPKKNSLRARVQQKAQDQKAILSLSIASVLVMSLFFNQWLISGHDKIAVGNRGIASFEGGASAQDVKWEHDLAQKLSQKDLQDPSQLADKPTMRDNLVFGYLQGKYGVKMNENQVESIEFIDAEAGEAPLVIEKKASFLLDYKAALGMSFDQVSLSNHEGNTETYSLISQKNIVASAQFTMDDQGRVTAVKIVK